VPCSIRAYGGSDTAMGQAELEDCTWSAYLRLGAVVEIGAQRLPSSVKTNREEMKPPPGPIVTYNREPVMQNWSIDGFSVTGPTLLEAYP
jgi:hypothetical protein